MNSKIHSIFLIILVIIAGNILYVSNGYNRNIYSKVIENAEWIEKKLIEINEEVLIIKNLETFNYDRIVTLSNRINERLENIKVGIDEIKASQPKYFFLNISQQKKYSQTVSEINVLYYDVSKKISELNKNIESFKTNNSILKNSLSYYTKYASKFYEIIEHNNKNLDSVFTHLTIDIHNLTNNLDENLVLHVLEHYNILSEQLNNLSSDDEKAKQAFLNHLKIITEKTVILHNKVDDIIASDIANKVRKFQETVSDADEISLKSKTYVLNSLYAVLIVLILYAIYLLVKLFSFSNNLQKINNELEISKRNAEQANKYKTEFLSNITHELRTPMHAILSYSEMGIDKNLKGEVDKVSKYLENINKSGKRLLSLINNLLDISKIEAGKYILKTKDYHISEIIDFALTEVGSIALGKRIIIGQNNFNKELKFDVDGEKILQVLINLLSNAIKFSFESGKINIDVRAINEDGKTFIRIAVIDEGVGIPDGEEDLIFEEFRQSSNNAGKVGGTGLGLSICKKIVEMHKGKIWAENNNSKDKSAKGATIFFSIPA
jgi:signal transduction histidine kinase